MLTCQGGDLRKALGQDALDGTHEFDWWHRGQDVALAMAKGLHFLHKNGIIHRCIPCRVCFTYGVVDEMLLTWSAKASCPMLSSHRT